MNDSVEKLEAAQAADVSNAEDDTIEFGENPYARETKKPEDVVRLFYTHDQPLIPVVSKRGVLIGILKKDDVISELSDISRVENVKVDDFITSLAKKMTFEELLPFGRIKEFIAVNIFGEVQESWSRIRLFTESEGRAESADIHESGKEQPNGDQTLEWMIYLILEHIPRALYAVNENGKTIFYNSHFEELYQKNVGKDVDSTFVEKAISSAETNEVVSSKGDSDLFFFNSSLNFFYERIPMISSGKKVGFLIFCENHEPDGMMPLIPGTDVRGMSLGEILSATERQLIAGLLNKTRSIEKTADELSLSRQSLMSKIRKSGIELPESDKHMKKSSK